MANKYAHICSRYHFFTVLSFTMLKGTQKVWQILMQILGGEIFRTSTLLEATFAFADGIQYFWMAPVLAAWSAGVQYTSAYHIISFSSAACNDMVQLTRKLCMGSCMCAAHVQILLKPPANI